MLVADPSQEEHAFYRTALPLVTWPREGAVWQSLGPLPERRQTSWTLRTVNVDALRQLTGCGLMVCRPTEHVQEASVPLPSSSTARSQSSQEVHTRGQPAGSPSVRGKGPTGGFLEAEDVRGGTQPASLPPPGSRRWGGLPSGKT